MFHQTRIDETNEAHKDLREKEYVEYWRTNWCVVVLLFEIINENEVARNVICCASTILAFISLPRISTASGRLASSAILSSSTSHHCWLHWNRPFDVVQSMKLLQLNCSSATGFVKAHRNWIYANMNYDCVFLRWKSNFHKFIEGDWQKQNEKMKKH